MSKGFAYVLYNKRSSTTGKALYKALKEKKAGGYEWRHSSTGNFQKTPTLVLRWGNAMRLEGDWIDFNPRDAVMLASNKLEMIRKLSEEEEVPTPSVAYSPNNIGEVSVDGYAYIRNSENKVRYSNVMTTTDRYALAPVAKESEYRVHVFNGKTMGVYRKVPHNANVRLYKNDTCDFVRLDQSNRDLMQGIKGVRPAAVKATEVLGLKFSGVDVLRTENGDVYVNEVNSAPSLNEPNIDRWVSTITEALLLESAQTETNVADLAVAEAEQRRLEAEAQAERLREQERVAREALNARLAEQERLRQEAAERQAQLNDLYDQFVAEAARRGFTLQEVLDR